MRKMPCLFERDFTDKRRPVLLRAVTLGCEWVLNGEGIASIKRDGTACAVIDGALYARFDAKRGKTPPPGAIPCDPEPDPVTGHWPHWVLVREITDLSAQLTDADERIGRMCRALTAADALADAVARHAQPGALVYGTELSEALRAYRAARGR